ncbi:hypothetical protein SCYAM73S_01834 [Streptomyces cyaneofuscatus]
MKDKAKVAEKDYVEAGLDVAERAGRVQSTVHGGVCGGADGDAAIGSRCSSGRIVSATQ